MNPAMAQHLEILGLQRSPFPPTPDTSGYFRTIELERELVEAGHCLRTRAGFVLLTGEIGTGKTTFLRKLIAGLEQDGMVVSLVFNTFLQGGDLLAAVLRDFALVPQGNPAADIETLNRFLLQCWQRQTTCVLVIDDAQNLDIESLELLRLLTCLESGQEKLLQIVLAGQPELLTLLAQPGIRQLTSRISKHACLDPLPAESVCAYVQHRLQAAGANDSITLHEDAAAALYAATGGNPRHIHLIMDRCLYGLYAQSGAKRHIDERLLQAAAAEAGVRQPRRKRRHTSTWAIAASLTAVCGIFATTLLRSSDSHAEPAQVAAVASNANDSQWERCLGRGDPLAVVRQSIPAQTAALLQAQGSHCVRIRDGQGEIAFSAPAAQQPLDQLPERVQQLQQQLHDAGHYDGHIDGRLGPLTRRAIARLQLRYHLPGTGTPDPLTLHLLDGVPPAATSSNTTDTPPYGHG